jgi:hypothetical protein
VLAGRVLVVAVLHRDAHGLQRVDRALAQVGGHVGGGEVEVRGLVEGLRGAVAGIAVGEVEELHLGRGVEAEAALAGPVEVAAQHPAGVALEGGAVDVGDVAEHPCGCAVGVRPGQQLEAVGIGAGENVALLDAAEAVDGGAVEAHPLDEGALQLGGRDGEALQLAEHVGEPEPDEPDPSLLDGAEHVVTLAFHGGAHDDRLAPTATPGSWSRSHSVHTREKAGKLAPESVAAVPPSAGSGGHVPPTLPRGGKETPDGVQG